MARCCRQRYLVTLLATALLVVNTPSGIAQEQPRKQVSFALCAVQATTEGREAKSYGPGLEPWKESLQSLSHDTFVRIKEHRENTAVGGEVRVSTGSRYAIRVQLIDQDTHGRFRLRARVIERRQEPGGKQTDRTALDTTCTVVPGRRLILRGIPLDKGELVILIRIT
jgi:hypothetical protein